MQLTEQARGEEIQVEAAAILLGQLDAKLAILHAFPAATLAKVRMPCRSGDGREGVLGAVAFLDHLRAGLQFDLSRVRATTESAGKQSPAPRRAQGGAGDRPRTGAR